jgi:hypothetical protein
MSHFEQSFPAAQIARELGIQVPTEDVPKLVSALHRAYAAGLRDGTDAEREECAQVCDSVRAQWSFHMVAPSAAAQCADAIRARGQKEGA